MAIYHLQSKIIGRGQGRGVVAAAAYRAAAALFDAEVGRTQNYLAKTGVVHSEILLPPGAPRRWLDRETLWNEVTAGEVRRDGTQRKSQLAREIEIALPRELSQAEAIALARDFVREQFVARGMVADLNVHWGIAADGEAQPHAHVLLSMRAVTADGFGLKQRAWNDRGLLRGWRERWAEMANARLVETEHDARIDHRSNAEQGLALAPQNKIGPAGARRAARGEDAERADEHRAIARRNGERLLAEPELALQALTQQQSTFTRRDLARLLHRQTEGAEQFAAVMAKVEASPELVRLGQDGRGRDRLTTRSLLATEQQMEAAAAALSSRRTHAVALARRQAAMADGGLGHEQSLAFGHVTRARDLAVVVGYAGTGKSTMLGVARQAWEADGYRVRGAALSGIAAEGLEGGSGIPSRTLASLELAWRDGRDLLARGDVLVVDEAGLIGSRQMQRLLAQVHDAGAKVVLVGDAEQLQAIEAGAAFRAIAERAGVVQITEVRRQHAGWQREATRELATGRTEPALGRYEAAGSVHAHDTLDAAKAALIAAWDTERRQRPEESRIILAHTRADVRDLNQRARALRQAAGELGMDHQVATEQGERVFAAGDAVLFGRNDRGLGVKNGTRGTVLRIIGAGEDLRLEIGLPGAGRDGRAGSVVSVAVSAYAHLDHGYAATVHKTQGVTVDRAHVLASAGMDRHMAYVALTRHRDGMQLHWSADEFGSREGLLRTLGRERLKDTSLDYAEGNGAAIPADPAACAQSTQAQAYAERRGLHPLVPVSAIVVQAGQAARRLVSLPRLARGKAQRRTLLAGLRPMAALLTEQAQLLGCVAEEVEAAAARRQAARAERAAAAPRTGPGVIAAALAALAESRTAEAGRERKMPQSGSPMEALLAALGRTARAPGSKPHTSIAERSARHAARLARERIAPLLPAEPYRPPTPAEVEHAVAEHVARLPEPPRLPGQLGRIYRDPEAARVRLDALLCAGSTEADALAVLVRRGPAVLGKLRGSAGLFAASERVIERSQAERAAQQLPEIVLEPRRRWAELAERHRDRLEAVRRRDTVTVPGLSAEALAAIGMLQQAGADRWPVERHRPAGSPAAEAAARAASVASAWSAILADTLVGEELALFRKAAEDRFEGRRMDVIDLPNGLQAIELADVLSQTEQLVRQDAEIRAAREAERQAELRRHEAEAVRQREQAAMAQARQEVEQARIRLEQGVGPRRPRPRPRTGPRPGPSSGPSMG